jgi:hypothetical protein
MKVLASLTFMSPLLTPYSHRLKTGMANAYAISEPTKEQLRKEGNHVLEDDRNDRRSDAGSVRESSEKLFGETTEVDVFLLEPLTGSRFLQMIKLANGETRIRVELAERKKREEILRRFVPLDLTCPHSCVSYPGMDCCHK